MKTVSGNKRRLKASSNPTFDRLEQELVEELFGDTTDEACLKWAKTADEPAPNVEGTDAAWVDEHDEEVEVDLSTKSKLKMRKSNDENVVSGKVYSERLREQFLKVNSQSNWAETSSERRDSAGASGDESDDDSYLRSTEAITAGADASLASGTISLTKMKDANEEERSSRAVTSAKFHPNGQLLLTSSLDKTLRLFHIDGVRNPKMQSMLFSDLPIKSSSFSPDGSEVWLSGSCPHYYVYNIETGSVVKVPGIQGRPQKQLNELQMSPDGKLVAFPSENGFVSLVSRKTKHTVGSVKMSGSVSSVAFSGDGSDLYTFGSDGVVMIWDVASRRCKARHVDEGCVSGTALAAAPRSGLFATGSNSGVVNIYENSAKPIRTVMSLTTQISSLSFNHDSQILAMASTETRNGLRLVHIPSRTVFSNWPEDGRTRLGTVLSTDFSSHSGFLAIASSSGRVLLYRLNHYDKA